MERRPVRGAASACSVVMLLRQTQADEATRREGQKLSWATMRSQGSRLESGQSKRSSYAGERTGARRWLWAV